MPPNGPNGHTLRFCDMPLGPSPATPTCVALALTQGESVNEAVERCWNGGTISRSKSGVA